MGKLLSSGAEALIFLENNNVLKSRITKSYRHEIIDVALRKSRTRREIKVIKSLENYGFVPKLVKNSDYDIEMEYISGDQVKKLLDKNSHLAKIIGKNLTVMHDLGIIHGDLTTSNMICSGNDCEKLYLIDFGLSFFSQKIEDKAVDIHLFKQALESKHFRVFDEAYRYFIDGYNPKDKREVLKRLSEVELRGRNKLKI